MRILTLIMAVTITLILPFGRASAQNSSIKGPRFATIGSATVNLVLPMNYCYLEESNQTDASLLKIMTSASASNRLLAAFASCKELAAWRAGTRTNLQNHGNFQTLLSAEHQNLSYGRAETAKAVCETLRKNKVDFRKIFSEGKNRTEKALPGAKILNQDVQGVLETTDNACYFGIYQHIRSQLGKEQQQIGVAATVLIKGKFFTHTSSHQMKAGRRSMPYHYSLNSWSRNCCKLTVGDLDAPGPIHPLNEPILDAICQFEISQIIC